MELMASLAGIDMSEPLIQKLLGHSRRTTLRQRIKVSFQRYRNSKRGHMLVPDRNPRVWQVPEPGHLVNHIARSGEA